MIANAIAVEQLLDLVEFRNREARIKLILIAILDVKETAEGVVTELLKL